MQPQTVIFMGPQGSGKGTQAERFGKRLRELDPDNPVIALETGQYFRELMESGTYTGERIKALLDEGKMIPDFFAKHIVLQDLAPQLTATAHLTMDGFPRTVEQVGFIDRLMAFYNRPQPAVVFLDVPESEVRRRMAGRGRFDDTEALITERLRLYRENTQPIVDAYQEHPGVRFIEIDGTKKIDDIAEEIAAFVLE